MRFKIQAFSITEERKQNPKEGFYVSSLVTEKAVSVPNGPVVSPRENRAINKRLTVKT